MRLVTYLHLFLILSCVHFALPQNCTGYFSQNCRTCNFTSCTECRNGFTPCNVQVEDFSSIKFCCPGNCVQGYSSSSYPEKILCLKCLNSYYGEDCDKRCHQRCIKCVQFSGDCVECAPGYSGDYCCPNNCERRLCNSSNGQSDACKKGFYGHFCDKSCPLHCLNKTCLSSGVCLDCENDYYGPFCNVGCSKNCVRCQSSNGHCELCEEGYFGSNCDVCPEYCSRGKCSIENGNCTYRCTNGFYGATCSNKCSKECRNLVCLQDTGVCSSCEAGKYGQHCESECPENCKRKVCHQVTGECLSGCTNGKFGDRCNYTCPSTCQDYSCKQKNGECNLGCFDNRPYGSFCNLPCPKTCNGKRCSFNGKCFSCEYELYGEICNTSCPSGCRTNSTAPQACDRDTGNCFHGCVNDFYGEMCNKRCEDACRNAVCDRDAAECLLFYMPKSSFNTGKFLPCMFKAIKHKSLQTNLFVFKMHSSMNRNRLFLKTNF